MFRLFSIFILGCVLSVSIRAEPARRGYTVRPYADSPAGDWSNGEDPSVRQAAVAALGRLNGAVVVADADTTGVEYPPEIV